MPAQSPHQALWAIFGLLSVALPASCLVSVPDVKPEVDSDASAPPVLHVPGRIQAEDYRKGGEGVAYHDSTPGNEGHVYRTDDVDLRACGDTGGGYSVWSTNVGEWLSYDVVVDQAGVYRVVLRVAQGEATSRLHLEVDNVDLTGPIEIANTGGWTNSFADVTKTGVVLAAGAHVLKVVWDATPGPDLNYIEFVSADSDLVGWGVCFNPVGSSDQVYDLMAQANIKIARFDLKWTIVEQQLGKYDFSTYDSVFTKLAAKGIRAYAILDYNNPLYGGTELSGIADESHRNGFAAFAQAAAAHFKNRNTIWEVWNEPNAGDPFWQPQEDAHQYTLLVKAAYPVVKAQDPTATVVGPATAFIANYETFFQACVQEGLLDYLDAVSTHPNKDLAPESGAVDQIYDVYRAIMQNAGHGTMPLIAGQTGYSDTWLGKSAQMQAKYDVRHMLYSVHKGVQLWMKFTLVNDGNDPGVATDNFGLLNSDLTPKPSYEAYKLMTTTLAGTQFDQSLSAGTGNYVLRWKGQNKTIYTYWTSLTPNQATVDGQGFDFTDTVQYLTVP